MKTVYEVGQSTPWGKHPEFVCETLADVESYFLEVRPGQDLTGLVKKLEGETSVTSDPFRGRDPVFARAVQVYQKKETKAAEPKNEGESESKKRKSD